MPNRDHISLRRAPVSGVCIAGALLIVFATAVPPVTARQATDYREQARVERLMIRGMTRLYIGDYVAAEGVFTEALRLRPDDSALLSSMAETKLAAGDPTSAAFFLERALAGDVDNRSLWLLAGRIYSDTGNTDRVVEAHRQSVRLDPLDVRGHIRLISLLSRLERYPDALSAVNVAIRGAGALSPLIELKADLLEHLGRVSGFELALIGLAELEPSEPRHRLRLAQSQIRRQALDEAERTLASLLERFPEHVEALELLRSVMLETGRNDLAEELAVRLETERNGASGTVVRASGENREAALRSLTDLNPEDAGAASELASLLRDEGRHAEAGRLYRRSARLEPRRLEDWSLGIESFLEAGLREEALDMVSDALMLFPGYIPIRILRVQALLAADQREAALQEAGSLRDERLTPDQQATIESLLQRLEAM